MQRFRTILCAMLLSLPAFAFAVEPVDINSADAQTLADAIKGVGLSRANAIVTFRDKHGPFEAIEDLTLVRGIGAKTIDANRDGLSVGEK